MKGADIMVGEEYAVREYGDSDVPKRAKVIAYSDRHRSHSDRTTRYYTVVWLDANGDETKRTTNVVSRKIVRTWTEHAPLEEQHRVAIAAEAERREASWAAYEAVIKRIAEIAPELQIGPRSRSEYERAPLSVSINLRQLAVVVDRLATHDRAVLDNLARRTAR